MSEEYDFIIVGAGSAGSVLAETLSRNTAHQVLLLEEGPDGEPLTARIPKGFAKLLANPQRTSYAVTEHDRGTGAPDMWLRGKMLGGSSAVNGMVWMRGQPADYDRYAERGLAGWSWQDLLPCFRALEDHELGASNLRGAGGPVQVNSAYARLPLADAVIAAGAALGLPRKLDQNGPDPEGLGYLQMNIDRRGRRVSAARAFLAPARRRPNLHVMTGVRADKVLLDGKRAVGVQGVRDGATITVRARGEVIVSAGALGSPRLLLLSGIGPAAALTPLGIKVEVDSRQVGNNMREHWLLALQFYLRHGRHSQNASFHGINLGANLLRYAVTGRGPLASGPFSVGGFIRTRPDLNRTDAQIMFMPTTSDETGGVGLMTEPGMQIFGYKLRPESSGTLTLRSADPSAPLHIAPNYLSDPDDRADSVAMIRFIRRLAQTEPLHGFMLGETPRTAEAHTDEEILSLFRRYGQAGFHACGTCAMGAGEDAVLDARARVRGVRGLRVVDLSMFPEMVSGNTNAPVMAFALRTAQVILDDAHAAGQADASPRTNIRAGSAAA